VATTDLVETEPASKIASYQVAPSQSVVVLEAAILDAEAVAEFGSAESL